MSYLLYPIALCVLLLFIQYLLTFLQLRKARFQYPKYQVIKPEQVPRYWQDLLQSAIAELGKLGFKPCSYLEYQPTLAVDHPTNWELLLYNQEYKTYATIVTHRLVDPVNLFDIDFYTFFKDKTLLITVNGKLHGLIADIPHTIVQDVYTSEVATQWLHHQNQLTQLIREKVPCVVAPVAFPPALQIYMSNYVKFLAQKGHILPIKDTQLWQINWLTSLKKVHSIVQGNKKAAGIVNQRRQKAKTDPSLLTEIPVELEVAGFQYMQYMQQGLLGKQSRTWLFLGSLAVFAASSTKFLNFKTVVIFIVVLLFHEGGHILAMRLFGYRDTSVLFVPFLGALATGHKHEATLSQKFWISLAGPLPGLVLGIVLVMLTPKSISSFDWLRETSWILISLNLLNLFPIYPLDGGKIANLLLFSRLPFADVGFKIIGVVIFVLLAKEEPGILLFLMLVALSIPGDFRNAQVSSKLHKEIQQNAVSNEDNLLYVIFKSLKKWGYGNLPFLAKYTLVKDLMQRYYEASGKWTTRVILVICYCISLFGGMVGSLQAMIPGWLNVLPYFLATPQQRHEHLIKKRQGQIDSLSATLDENPNDVNAYKHRARLRMISGDEEGALADYNQVIRLMPNDIAAYLSRAGIRRRLLDYEGAIQEYNEILRVNPKNLIAYQQRAQVRNLIQDYQGAIADYNQIIQLNPNNTWVYLWRGQAKQKLQDYKGALIDAEYMIKQHPNSGEAYQLRSEVRESLGDTQGAIADQQLADKLFKRIEQEDPS